MLQIITTVDIACTVKLTLITFEYNEGLETYLWESILFISTRGSLALPSVEYKCTPILLL